MSMYLSNLSGDALKVFVRASASRGNLLGYLSLHPKNTGIIDELIKNLPASPTTFKSESFVQAIN